MPDHHVTDHAVPSSRRPGAGRRLPGGRQRGAGELLALAREEERHRLRAELHDGLGPALQGAALHVEALRRRLGVESDASALLASLADDLAGCRRELCRLIDGGRPAVPAGGLGRALRVELSRFRASSVRVVLDCPDELGELPAAVAVAALRIVAEAVANAVRHSRGRRCVVRVRRSVQLELTVTDDGRGLGADGPGRGVGLGSMRRRAVEVGGELTVRSGPAGVQVAAQLPLRSSEVPERAGVGG